MRYKSEIKMIVSDILNKKNDYKQLIFKVDLRTLNFDDIIIIYARDNILFDKIK